MIKGIALFFAWLSTALYVSSGGDTTQLFTCETWTYLGVKVLQWIVGISVVSWVFCRFRHVESWYLASLCVVSFWCCLVDHVIQNLGLQRLRLWYIGFPTVHTEMTKGWFLSSCRESCAEFGLDIDKVTDVVVHPLTRQPSGSHVHVITVHFSEKQTTTEGRSGMKMKLACKTPHTNRRLFIRLRDAIQGEVSAMRDVLKPANLQYEPDVLRTAKQFFLGNQWFTGNFCLLTEFVEGLCLEVEEGKASYHALETGLAAMARLHGHFWGSKSTDGYQGLYNPAELWNQSMLKSEMPDLDRKVFSCVLSRPMTKTVVHGDCRMGNIVIESLEKQLAERDSEYIQLARDMTAPYRANLIDFSAMHYGNGTEDIAFVLVLDSSAHLDRMEDLLRYYHGKLMETKAKGQYPLETFMDDFWLFVFRAVFIMTVPGIQGDGPMDVVNAENVLSAGLVWGQRIKALGEHKCFRYDRVARCSGVSEADLRHMMDFRSKGMIEWCIKERQMWRDRGSIQRPKEGKEE